MPAGEFDLINFHFKLSQRTLLPTATKTPTSSTKGERWVKRVNWASIPKRSRLNCERARALIEIKLLILSAFLHALVSARFARTSRIHSSASGLSPWNKSWVSNKLLLCNALPSRSLESFQFVKFESILIPMLSLFLPDEQWHRAHRRRETLDIVQKISEINCVKRKQKKKESRIAAAITQHKSIKFNPQNFTIYPP